MEDNKEPRHMDPGRRLGVWLSWAGGALILLCAFAVSLDVITRKLLGQTFLESFELTRYAFAIAIAFGFSTTALSLSHIRIDVLYNALPRAVCLFLDVVSMLSLAGLAAFLAWYGWDLALDSLVRGSRSPTGLRMPLAVPQILWASGLTLFFLSCVWMTGRAVAALLRGRPDLATLEIGTGESYAIQSLEHKRANAKRQEADT